MYVSKGCSLLAWHLETTLMEFDDDHEEEGNSEESNASAHAHIDTPNPINAYHFLVDHDTGQVR